MDGGRYVQRVANEGAKGAAGADVERVRAAWAGLAGVQSLAPLQVLVQPESSLCPPGWVGVLVVDGTITVAVPDGSARVIVSKALSGLEADVATDPDTVTHRVSGITDLLGPASLFYALTGVEADEGLKRVDLGEVLSLLQSVGREELDESGLPQVTSPLYVENDAHGAPVAACGYRHWPQRIAHLCVLVHPDARGRGLARRVAAGAIAAALEEGLLPQWRARGETSKAVARRLGLIEVGSQLSFRLSA